MFLVSMILLKNGLYAQNMQPCGVTDMTNDQYQALMLQISGNNNTNLTVFEVPVHFIIVKDGYSNVSLNNIEAQINNANFAFQDFVHFYICGITTIQSSEYAVFNASLTEWTGLYELFHNDNAINVYLAEEVFQSGGAFPAGGIARFPIDSYPNNMIILPYSPGSFTLAHELGHYFSLAHTFAGSLPGPNGSCYLIPPDEPCNGDYICDTPVDPGTGYCGSECNEQPCTATCNGMTYTYNVDKKNIMSYYGGCTDVHFSPLQIERMFNTLTMHPSRIFLTDTNEPVCSAIIPEKGRIDRNCNEDDGNTSIDPFPKAPVDIENVSSPGVCYELTANDGQYSIVDCQINGYSDDYNITPHKDFEDNTNYVATNGVTAFDLLQIRKHILGIQTLSNKPFSWVSADVNNSGGITAFDLVFIKKVILHIDETFEAGSWRFVPSYYFDPQFSFATQFNDNPFTAQWQFSNQLPRNYLSTISTKSYMDEVDLDLSNSDITNQASWSFKAIKTGDVDCSAIIIEQSLIQNETNINIIPTSHTCISAGESAIVAVKTHHNGDVAAYQFGLEYDPSVLEITGENTGDIPGFSLDNFGLNKLSSGELKTLWVEPTTAGVSFKDKVMFKLHIKAKEEICDITEVLKFSSIMPIGFYDQQKALSDMDISFSVTPDSQIHKLTNIYPSPFSSGVNFSFELFSGNKVTALLSDSFGNTVYEEATFPLGTNTLTISNTSSLQGSNIYYTVYLGPQLYTGALLKL